MHTRFSRFSQGLNLSLAAVLLALAWLGPAASRTLAQTEGSYITVTVQAGQSLVTFTRIYGVSGSALLAVNNLKDPNKIYPGQTLVIPVLQTFTPSLTTPFYYTAQAGDTLATVARRFEQDPIVVGRINGVSELTSGVTYLLPAGPHIYTLKRGDTIASVAARYGVTSQVVLDNNTIPNPAVIYAGQQFLIPMRLDARPIPIPDLVLPTAVPVDENGATLTPLPTATGVATSTAPTGYTQITVKAGDTLLTYVKLYGVSARAIIDANPSLRVNPALLMPGQKLLIPAVLPTATTVGATAVAVTATSTPAPTGTPAPTATPNLAPVVSTYIQAQVRAGDTLLTFVQRYGVTASALLAANPALKNNPGLIYPGQTLTIPVAASFDPSRTTPFFYVVQPGENAALIALQFEMASNTLLKANPGVTVAAGVTLLVPAGPHVYVVQKGDQLRYIAPRYNLTAVDLQRANNLPNPDVLYVGQELLIPIQYNAAPLLINPAPAATATPAP